MIAAVMIYATEVAALLGIAAWAIERVAIWRGLSRRLGWVVAMILSVAIPLVSVTTSPKSPPVVVTTPGMAFTQQTEPSAAAATTVPIRAVTSSHAQHPHRVSLQTSVTLEKSLAAIWLLGSCGLLTAYVILTLRLRLAARRWRRQEIEGQQVWITDSLGPAVYGFIRPIILLPEWLLQADGNELAVALTHERSHLAARDPALLLLGLLVIAFLPWNVPLWWQLRRLRFAIEVDCDARVLNRGMTPRDYGAALLAIGERGSAAPAGAVALTEPASQLLRRIRIMMADLPKRGTSAVLATVALALTCVGVAAGTQAPSTVAARASDIDLPRKLPVDENVSHPELEAMVRATYPQFFRETGNTQPELVSLFLNPDGSLYRSVAEEVAPRPYIATSFKAFDDVGIDYEHRGPRAGVRLAGASGLPVDIIAWYFQAPQDPSRDVATVRAKTRARYAELLDSPVTDKAVTVLMTDAGEIDRATVETLNGRSTESLATASHFATLGFPGDRIGLVGVTSIARGHFNDDPDARVVPVVYAWPRRPNEPAAHFEVFNRGEVFNGGTRAARNDDRDADRVLAEHYFPDIYTYPQEWPRADPWILLDRQGKVLTSGRRIVNSGNDIKLNIESLYPGVKTDRLQIMTLVGPRGQRPAISFVWLAADSPVTDPMKADFSKQPDVLIYADVTSGGRTFYTQMLALSFGSSGKTQCALRNPFGVVWLQVAVDKGDSAAATVRIRAQHLPLPASESIPGPVENAWSQESPPVRAVYGGSSETQIIDAEGRKWDIVLHTDRLPHSPPAKT
jgi:beta-lactamase regulating signal transducer with metallopeptidase domain